MCTKFNILCCKVTALSLYSQKYFFKSQIETTPLLLRPIGAVLRAITVLNIVNLVRAI
jgi:hypothetical protein